MTNPIGAQATIKYLDDGTILENVYFSFGEYIEERNEDSYGVSDYNIFFYCEDEEDMKSFMTEGGEDFIVLSYEPIIAIGFGDPQ